MDVVLRIKYELKELRMNVFDTFWRGRHLDNERRWQRFKLNECFLVLFLLSLRSLIIVFIICCHMKEKYVIV